MDREALKTAMRDSISEVLEKMFFLPLDYTEKLNPHEVWKAGKDKVLAAVLGFRGPFSGYVIFFIPEAAAASLAAGFLGQEAKDVLPQHASETAKEIVNMVAGNAFSLFDNQSIFDLETPKVVSLDKIGTNQVDWGKSIFISLNTLDSSLAFGMVIRS